MFLAEDERGHTRCLRPELTIPAARAHVAAGARGPIRYALAGTVFRQRGPGEADEFPQAGIETVGGEAAAGGRARARRRGRAGGRTGAGPGGAGRGGRPARYMPPCSTRSACRPPPGARLVRLHGDGGAALAALEAMGRGDEAAAPEDGLGADPALPAPLRAALAAGDAGGLERAVAGAIAAARMGKGARSPREIAPPG